MRLLKSLAVIVSLMLLGQAARAQDVTYYEKDGVTYRETRSKVRRPITELQHQDQVRTVYREKLDTGTQTVVQSYHTPVTEYQTRSKLVGRWNPFVREPYYQHEQVPVTRWEQRHESVQVPVTTRSLVPETTTVRVPVAQTRIVEDEIVHRVAVGTRPTTTAALPAPTTVTLNPPPQTQVAARPQAAPVTTYAPVAVGQPILIGGIKKLDQDPPRTGNNVPWRPADVNRR